MIFAFVIIAEKIPGSLIRTHEITLLAKSYKQCEKLLKSICNLFQVFMRLFLLSVEMLVRLMPVFKI